MADQFQMIYNIVILGILIGVSVLAFSKLGDPSIAPEQSSGSLNTTAENFGNFLTDWFPIILLFCAVGLILFFV
jgi:hypothetical protein